MTWSTNPTREAKRAHQRTSLFVLASMSGPQVVGSIKIRNLSLRGALIEGAALPEPGQAVVLRRAELWVSGRIVWRSGDRAGVRFDDQVQVANWLPAGGAGMERADPVLQRIRAPGTAGTEPSARRPAQPISQVEINRVADELDALAEDLVNDAAIVAAHPSKLQALEIASQLLREWAEQLPTRHAICLAKE